MTMTPVPAIEHSVELEGQPRDFLERYYECRYVLDRRRPGHDYRLLFHSNGLRCNPMDRCSLHFIDSILHIDNIRISLVTDFVSPIVVSLPRFISRWRAIEIFIVVPISWLFRISLF